MKQATLLVSARDKTGLIAALSDLVFRYGGNIIDADQHSDEESGMFFMRLAWSTENFTLDEEGIRDALGVLARGFDEMKWDLWYGNDRQRVVIFCSKTPHCLYDLMLRHQLGELNAEIVHIVSNHETLSQVSEHFGVPFTCIPVSKEDKVSAEEKQLALLDELKPDLIVLARYMQIISPEFVARYPNRIINIHHSFLPAFIGAKPYHQAKQRGVKVIGATAHYVTADLDAGPIIQQDVVHVSHRDSVESFISKGRDLERNVLSNAVRLHLQHSVLVHNNRTVVFE